MTAQTEPARAPKPRRSGFAEQWHYIPDVPIQASPFFSQPATFMRMLKWIAARWLRVAENSILLGLATLCWFYLQPPLEVVQTLSFDWILMMYVRNLLLMTVVAGGLHLYFYTFRKQGDIRKYDARPMKMNARAFTFNNQILDNVFWSLTSGVASWTAYEALMLWSMANGYIPTLHWDDSPLLFVLLLVLTPVWISFHFYWVHRWLHLPWAYRKFHALHHRNINVGPWSGLSMHPVEHLIFFSSVLIHGVIAAHPIHILFHMQHQALTAATSHTGYEGIFAGEKNLLALGTFHHQLHHRYFQCNYGNLEVPIDAWAGSYHDGTEESHAAFMENKRIKDSSHIKPKPIDKET